MSSVGIDQIVGHYYYMMVILSEMASSFAPELDTHFWDFVVLLHYLESMLQAPNT